MTSVKFNSDIITAETFEHLNCAMGIQFNSVTDRSARPIFTSCQT
jgi:hypothetical protein